MQYKSLPVFILFLLIPFVLSGQKQINSPYARFNLGILEPNASFKSMGMGGIGIATRSNSSVYFANPASYSAIDTISFIFDVGIDYGINKMTDGTKDYLSEDMNFDHLLMGFPVSKRIGVAMGIVPVSSGYYNLSEAVTKKDPDYDPVVGEYTSVHTGDGGLSNVFLGTGVQIGRHLSAGINMNILFGQMKRYYRVTFSDYLNAYNNTASEKLELHGIDFDYGLHYTTVLKNNFFLNAGVTAGFGKNYNASYEQLAYRYTVFGTTDTISFISDDSSSVYIPGTLGAGIVIGKVDKFTMGFDFVMTKWSESRIPGPDDYAADSKCYRFGLEYIPDKYSNYSYLRRVEYRLGAHYGDNYLIIHNEQIREYGGSFGIGLPMRRSNNRTNLFFDYTRRYGSGVSTNHTENYYLMGISLNLYDHWFIKRKYN